MRRKMSGAVTQVGTPVETVEEYYRLIDSGDLHAASRMFAEDAEMQGADDPVLCGRATALPLRLSIVNLDDESGQITAQRIARILGPVLEDHEANR
jgi:hypothetical protein